MALVKATVPGRLDASEPKDTSKSGAVVRTLTIPASSSTHSLASWGVPAWQRREPNCFAAYSLWMELRAHGEGLPGNCCEESATTVIVCFRDKRAWGVALCYEQWAED